MDTMRVFIVTQPEYEFIEKILPLGSAHAMWTGSDCWRESGL